MIATSFGKPGRDSVDRRGRRDAPPDDEARDPVARKFEASDVAFLRGRCQYSPSDPELSDGPLEPR